MQRRSARIADQIEREILSGSLPSGGRLPSEEKLCAQYAVSRTVVREALQQLRGRGIVRSLKGSGTFIADPSLESLGSAVATYSILAEEADFLDLIDFRILIETECARLAAANAGQRILGELRQILSRMDRASGDREAFSTADIAFHLAIAEASGNGVYATVLGALERRCIDFAQVNRTEDDWFPHVVAQHAEILDQIEAGAPEQAGNAMRRHLLSSRRHFIDLKS